MRIIGPQDAEKEFAEVMRLASITAIANRWPRVVGMLLKPGEKPWFGHLAAKHHLTQSPFWTSAWWVRANGVVVAWRAADHVTLN